jgi:integrase
MQLPKATGTPLPQTATRAQPGDVAATAAPKRHPIGEQLTELAARLFADRLRITETEKRGSDVVDLTLSADRLEASLKTRRLFERFGCARKFFANCIRIETEAAGDPVALDVLAEFPDDEIKIFWVAIEDMPGMSDDIRDALRLQLLTAARINDVVEASRDEIDWNAKLWIFPGVRTKSGREHQLPLSELALSILRDLIARGDLESGRRARRAGATYVQSPWLFPSQRSVSSLMRRSEPLKRQRRTAETLEPRPDLLCACGKIFAQQVSSRTSTPTTFVEPQRQNWVNSTFPTKSSREY